MFGLVQQCGLAARRFAALVHRVADGFQHFILLAPHLLGEELQLALVRDVRGDALRFHDVRHQLLGNRQARQLRGRQRHQLLGQAADLQRLDPLPGAAGAIEFAGFGVASAHGEASLSLQRQTVEA